MEYTPVAWQKVKATFIPKLERDSYYEAKSFRPINPTSFALKTLEKLVDFYMKEEILPDKSLNINQFASQKGKSTVDAIHAFTYSIQKAWRIGAVAKAAFWACRGAIKKPGD